MPRDGHRLIESGDVVDSIDDVPAHEQARGAANAECPHFRIIPPQQRIDFNAMSFEILLEHLQVDPGRAQQFIDLAAAG